MKMDLENAYPFSKSFLNSIEKYWQSFNGNDYTAQAQFVDQNTYLPHLLLDFTDKMSMAASLEVRVPFLDHKLLELCTTINSEFKIKLQNLENISFKFIPSPHLVIKKADFKIRDNETDSIAELKKIKVYISISEFYKFDTFKIKKITVSKANLYLNSLSLKNFIQNLKKSVVNHFVINLIS